MTEASERRATLSERTAERIVDGIMAGRFRFGQRLPPERELAGYLEVGRQTLREAIRILSVLGLVEARHGDGTFVVDRHSEFINRAFGWAVLLDWQSVDELIETRSAVECALAELAATRARPSDITTLRGLLNVMSGCDPRSDADSARFAKADLEFHLAISAAAQNVTLSRLLLSIQSLLKQWITKALKASDTAQEDALRQHIAIFEAIEARDPDRVRQATRDHVQFVGDLIRTGDFAPRARESILRAADDGEAEPTPSPRRATPAARRPRSPR